MAIKNQSITVQYTAWDTSANTGKTGDVGNHTLRVVTDGTAAAPSNAASEIDATNLPGVYKITLTAAEMNGNTVTLGGYSGTSNVVIIPLHIVTERGEVEAIYNKLPTNYLMGSSVQTDKDDEIDAIKAVTDVIPNSGALTDIDTGVNAIEAKLPTNYIMGSSVQTDKDDEIDAILADTNELQQDWQDTGRLDTLIDQIITDIAALNDISAAQVNAEIVDALSTDTYAEPGAVPAATASLAAKLGWLFALARNKMTQTATTQTLRNDADSADIATSAVSDDGTTFTRGEFA